MKEYCKRAQSSPANEPLYEDIPKVVPGLNGSFACKRALVAMLI